MGKPKTLFFCSSCGAQSVKWIGKCPSCGEWNTYIEEIIQKETGRNQASFSHTSIAPKPRKISEIDSGSEQRINTGNMEFNRVLGGGLVPGSLVLVGGEPGIGKSTLILQVAMKLKGFTVLYITGEESEQQIRLRSDRLQLQSEDFYVLTETNLQRVFLSVESLKPDIIVVDSIQTVHTDLIDSSAGSISQIRECAAEFQKYAKTTNTPVILIGHITKDGAIAGPKILEHMVDTVLQFEGERNYGYRILRSVKNRFGSTSELGIFEMSGTGLREVTNPSEILLSNTDINLSGITISAMVEGVRPMLVETQALVSTAAYGTPIRSSTGFDTRRLNMLLAVLEKRSGFRLGAKDVFLNIAGGIRVDDPAIDLAVVTAILSSSEDIPVSKQTCFAAEVGLSGEIRTVNRLESRIAEAEKLGMKKIFVSRFNQKGVSSLKAKIEIVPVGRIDEVFSGIFG